MGNSVSFSLNDYDYHLPSELIAFYPHNKRHKSKLMVIDRSKSLFFHKRFCEILDLISQYDMLILNDTKVFPARLFGKRPTGGRVEIALLNFPQETGDGRASASALLRASRHLRTGTRIYVGDGLEIEIGGNIDSKTRKILLYYDPLCPLIDILRRYGHVPLPPYIKREDTPYDIERYQTVFAQNIGSVAAPTAGFHFSRSLLRQIQKKGTLIKYITLHVGYGTFSPVTQEDIRRHNIHPEWIEVKHDVIKEVLKRKKEGEGRVICVGTTSVRAIEYVFKNKLYDGYEGMCDLYIYPNFEFIATDAMITNFHLPKSSLLILVASFVGRRLVLNAYKEAIEKRYRFFSYGDSMIIL